MDSQKQLGQGFAYGIVFRASEKQNTHFWEVILTIAFCVCLVVVSSFLMSYAQYYLENKMAAEAAEVPTATTYPTGGISELINSGYLKASADHVNTSEMPEIIPADGEVKNQALGEQDSSLFLNQPSQELQSSVVSTGKVLGVTIAKEPYQALLTGQSFDSLNIAPGKAITFWVEFKNTGTVTWKNSGQHFLALNVTSPTGRQSAFKHRYWIKDYRPAKLLQPEVKPGETGRLRFALLAPKTEEYYQECFGLVAENLTWLPGGNFCLPVKVGNPAPWHQAKKLRQSQEALSLQAGAEADFWVDFENRGRATWDNSSEHFIALNATNPTGRHSVFQYSSWVAYYRPVKMAIAKVKRSEAVRFNFKLKAPLINGSYLECFGLVAESLTWIPDGDFCLTIAVTGGEDADSCLTASPSFRVGLFVATGPITATANSDYQIQSASGETLLSRPAGAEVALSYSASQYLVSDNGQTVVSAGSYLRLVPALGGIVTLVNYHNEHWESAYADNQFRGAIELRLGTDNQTIWVINELPLEHYLRGLAETGNSSPAEYQKALITAARTYAKYHYDHGTKHADGHFHVDDYGDQVYRGYGFEQRTPNLTAAVLATCGQIVTYNGELAITPYFSHSDGRTRAWEEVWAGGPYPWLVSVADPHCQGMELLGHGVGMSALGAYLMADEDSATYYQILKHYYTGVEVKKIY